MLGPNGGHILTTFGAPNFFDIPAPGDFGGLGYTQPAVFRPSTGQWLVLGPNGGYILGSFGSSNFVDVPVQTPVYALYKKGILGGVHVAAASASESSAPKAAPLIVSTPLAPSVAFVAPEETAKRHAQPSYDELVAAAVESLFGED